MDPLAGLRSLELPVVGMSSAACSQQLIQALEGLPGVERAEARNGRVRLEYYAEALSAEAIRARIEALGYGVAAPARSRNPIRRFLERLGEANAKALEGKRLDCCKLVDKGS